ncbi:MAG: HAMP domain-containing sensor histidine kinase [Ruminococcus sp.]|nr:HAMP domain-containing sensor histidine kinase [Ruminococcus sp.]
MFKGITKRWVLNTLLVVVVVVLFVVFCLSYAVRIYYYHSVTQTLSAASAEFASVLEDYSSDSIAFASTARGYVENFDGKEIMEITAIDKNGKVIITSTGFTPDSTEQMPDYIKATAESLSYFEWTGKLSSGENVKAVTRLVKNSEGEIMGAVRCIISLTDIDRTIGIAIAIFCGVGLLIISLVLSSGIYFIRSIVRPVGELSETAKKIAQGDFNTRIEKVHDDEIGDLCDSINYMATELGASERLKNDFISSVSHELRTPLTAIKGWAETMQYCGTVDKETFDKGMDIIVKESSRLTSIVEELLDFSRLQSGRMVLSKEKLDILAELDEALYMMKERAISEEKHLLYDKPEAMPPVFGDKNKLRQVFINIIDNALKYTQSEGVVGIQVLDFGEFVHVVVTDTGCGIAPDDLPRIKDKFYKANQNVRGSGIGLAIADEIIALHGGTLDIESGIGVGTTVTIAIPVAEN